MKTRILFIRIIINNKLNIKRFHYTYNNIIAYSLVNSNKIDIRIVVIIVVIIVMHLMNSISRFNEDQKYRVNRNIAAIGITAIRIWINAE